MNWINRLFGRERAQGDGAVSTLMTAPTNKRERDSSPLVKHKVKTLIAPGVTVDGPITAMDGAAIDGVVNGGITIRGADSALLIRAGSVVNGDIRAPIVILGGEVNGDIVADTVRMYAGSRHFGRVQATQLIVDRGASVNNENMSVGGSDERKPTTRLSLVSQGGPIS
jgi:cytoskeletal protein CcmA (bactofilin family)